MRLLESSCDALRAGRQRIRHDLQPGHRPLSPDGANAGQLLRSAGLAVGHCKRSGRNRSQRFTTELQRDADDLLSLEMDLRRPWPRAACTWLPTHRRPRRCAGGPGSPGPLAASGLGPLSPERFVRVAEETGLIADLDGWVMRQACADLAQLHREGHAALRVSVNCSALNLSDRLLPQSIARALQAEDLPASALILEVTENA